MKKINELKIFSNAFENNQLIPEIYTCKGENINPPLFFSNIPSETKSMVLIVDDPDAPSGDWVHWILWNIPINITEINSNSLPIGISQGLNDSNKNRYDGPCPPSGTHRYFFKLYAIDTILNLDINSRKSDIEKAIENHILEKTELIGLFSK